MTALHVTGVRVRKRAEEKLSRVTPRSAEPVFLSLGSGNGADLSTVLESLSSV